MACSLVKSSYIFHHPQLKRPSFDLVAINGPVRVWLLFTAVEFQVWTETYLLDELAEAKRLAAVPRARSHDPTRDVFAPETQPAANANWAARPALLTSCGMALSAVTIAAGVLCGVSMRPPADAAC
jgi:hypothetical protein